jgi:hypothetical protein
VKSLIEIFFSLYRRVRELFTKESGEVAISLKVVEAAAQPRQVPALSEMKPDIPPANGPVTQPVPEAPVADGKWIIRPCHPQTFEKVGRVLLATDSGKTYLAIRCDRLTTQYMIRWSDLDEILQNGVSRPVRRDTGSASGGTIPAGIARLSTSGMALNITIGEQLHTVPMKSLNRVLTGENRKAALFVPVDGVT